MLVAAEDRSFRLRERVNAPGPDEGPEGAITLKANALARAVLEANPKAPPARLRRAGDLARATEEAYGTRDGRWTPTEGPLSGQAASGP